MMKTANSVMLFAILSLWPAQGIGQEKPADNGEPQTAEDAYRRASKLLQSQRREEAIVLFSKAIVMKPDWAEAYAARGLAHYQAKHYSEAILDCDQAIKLQDGRAQWYNRRGLAYSYSGHHDRAIEDYNKAIELNGDDSAYYNNRGWAYRELSQYDNAIRDLSHAIELRPDFILALENRGTAYVQMKDWPHAIADCTAAIELAPTASHYRKRAEVKLMAGDAAGSEGDRRLAAEHETPAQQTAVAPTSSGAPAAPGSPYKIGGTVTPPSLLHKVEPQYTEEARRTGLEGTVVLNVVVTSEGNTRDMRVVRSLGMGLDEKAIEAVSKWKFSPGMKDGKPVDVQASIQVNFRLLKTPAR